MKPKFERAIVTATTAVFAANLLGGCSGLVQTLDRGKQALVKMPVPVNPDRKTRHEGDGIIFQQAFAAPTIGKRPATWFLAWRKDGLPVLANHRDGLEDIARGAHTAMKRYPILVEENFVFKTTGRRFGPAEARSGELQPEEKAGDQSPARAAVAVNRPSVVWPYRMTSSDVEDWKRRHPGEAVPDFDPLWHLGDNYTQLRRARSEVGSVHNDNRIKIGHLDNGFTKPHVGAPPHMPRDHWAANCTGLAATVQRNAADKHPAPGETHGSHGTGTIGILAGGRLKMPPTTVRGVKIGGINESIGGAPEANVLSVRVAPWVGSLSSAELAYGIDLASRVHGCEVISMSHGGLPTVAWADAINAAYERGTAIIAAESDYFSLVPRPLYPSAFIWPSSPVWPAAFRRVLGVTGVQKDGTTYAKNGGIPLTGFLRGSYGPDGARNFGIFSERDGDPETVRYGGKLRAHPIAAFAPNIVWPTVRKDKVTGRPSFDGLDFDGGGTSSATPQVAAAAALWLQKHRDNFPPGTWNTWRRAEAVYYALLRSASRKGGMMKPDMYLGAGILKAHDALKITPREALAAVKPRHDPAHPGKQNVAPVDLCFPTRYSKGRHDEAHNYGMTSDYADGERSFKAFFGLILGDLSKARVDERKNLNEETTPGESFEKAMKRIRENDKLIRQWRDGRLPKEEKPQEVRKFGRQP